MTRRDLIQKVILGGTVLVITPSVIESCSKSSTDTGGNGNTNIIAIDLTNPKYASLNSAGGSVVLQGIIVANIGANSFVALSSRCTHQGCTISYNGSTNNFPCPCHGSVFSTSGSVVNGPATTALQTYPITKNGNNLVITL